MTVDQNVSFYEEQIQLFTAVHDNADTLHRNAPRRISARNAPRSRDCGNASGTSGKRWFLLRVLPPSKPFRSASGCRTGSVAWRRSSRCSRNTWPSLRNWRANGWTCRSGLKKLPKARLSERDKKKISDLQDSFQQQLTQYKMGSLDCQRGEDFARQLRAGSGRRQSQSRRFRKRSHPAALGISSRASRSRHADLRAIIRDC